MPTLIAHTKNGSTSYKLNCWLHLARRPCKNVSIKYLGARDQPPLQNMFKIRALLSQTKNKLLIAHAYLTIIQLNKYNTNIICDGIRFWCGVHH